MDQERHPTPADIEAFTAGLEGHGMQVTNVDAPLRPDGVWSIDVASGERKLYLEWREDEGFGLFEGPDDEVSYGERPNRIVRSPADAIAAMAGGFPTPAAL